MALMLLNKKGKLDQSLLISSESEAIEWGKELFKYYMTLSKKVSREKTNYFFSEQAPTLERAVICEKTSI
ncbi:hypothetical protein SDC9_111253 [bioreactor metagenome]|uniref:Methanogenesis regulatory protein FilR1 middle domain-containing protein n=1 Tax=bioreactor metagenome TaxID=1076179 RepID=A0A645BGA0_9ZZZZ